MRLSFEHLRHHARRASSRPGLIFGHRHSSDRGKEHSRGGSGNGHGGMNGHRRPDSTALDSRNHSNAAEDYAEDDSNDDPLKLPVRERLRHFTWTWFTLTMATGGIANVLYTIPEPLRFPGLTELGITFFLLNIGLFLGVMGLICARFWMYPTTFRASFLHPTETLFVPAAIVSVGIILMNITQYGVGSVSGDWLERTMIILYWIYSGWAVAVSSLIYLIIWSTQTFTISNMTPVWIFPAYPLLIVGPHAGQLAGKVAREQGQQIVVGGFIIQGIGFMVSLMIYSAFLYRLMTHKLPQESVRPGMFVSIGPSGFTISGIITMGQVLPNVVSKDFMINGQGPLVATISSVAANWAGLWLWGLAFWFFFISIGSHISSAAKGRIHFAMTWFSFVFPNTALATATFAVSRALGGVRSIQIIGCVLTIGVVVTWFFVFAMMVRAVLTRQILWPQRQEDRDEGGWRQDEEQKRSMERKHARSRKANSVQRKLREKTAVGPTARSKRQQDSGRRSADASRRSSEEGEDRADYAIKQAQRKSGGSPTRGRHLNV